MPQPRAALSEARAKPVAEASSSHTAWEVGKVCRPSRDWQGESVSASAQSPKLPPEVPEEASLSLSDDMRAQIIK